MKVSKLLHDRLLEALNYDPITGVFTWRIRPSTHVYPGDRAGRVREDGWRQIRLDNVMYRAGRLAFFYMTGRWPEPTIEHENRIRSDDRWSNLKEATHYEQHQNTSKCKTGHPNIYFRSGKYVVRTRLDPKQPRVLIGRYDTLEEAVSARVAALEASRSSLSPASAAAYTGP